MEKGEGTEMELGSGWMKGVRGSEIELLIYCVIKLLEDK
jgi:hypothetical protein